MARQFSLPSLDAEKLRDEIKAKYCEVATSPEQGFHFHHGRYLAGLLGYPDELVDNLPGSHIDS